MNCAFGTKACISAHENGPRLARDLSAALATSLGSIAAWPFSEASGTQLVMAWPNGAALGMALATTTGPARNLAQELRGSSVLAERRRLLIIVRLQSL